MLKFSKHSFGYVDLEKMLSYDKGMIKNTFLDMGSTFIVKNEFEYNIKKDKITIWPKKNPKKKINIPKKIELYPEFIACIGLYEGDGSKHAKGGSNIGFSQREIHLHKFMKEQLEVVFLKSFELSWNILDDPRSFVKPERMIKLENYKNENNIKSPIKCKCEKKLKLCICGAEKLQKEFLLNEFQEEGEKIGMKINSDEIKNITISNVKGGLERIQEFKNSKDFLALWLKIEHSVVENIVNNIKESNDEAIIFYSNPHDSDYSLDVQKYVKSIKWKLLTRYGKYQTEIKNNKLYISRSKIKEINVERNLKISPLICVNSGLYLAEGSTKKDYLFLFENVKVPLNISLTHTDAVNIQSYCMFLEKIGENLLSSWKVKIGTKYESEVELLAQRYGVIALRGGELGQGYVRTIELDMASKQWALDQVKYLEKYSELFHHTELTGVGIPRIDISGDSVSSHYIISLIRDISFFTQNLDEYIVIKKEDECKNV